MARTPLLALALGALLLPSSATADSLNEGPLPVPVEQQAEDGGPAATRGGGPVGIGIGIGTINGFALKIWPARQHGIVFNAGVIPARLNSLALSLGYRFHFNTLGIADSPVALAVNLGPVFRSRIVFLADPGPYVEIGGGVGLGVSLLVEGTPAEIFFDIQPVVAGSATATGTGVGFDVDGLVGVRFYPGG